ncbi:uncharacterized protein PgNI_04121 [Pyricularia grisea]|uniref:Uncharacterized protein n=1 Tax=Pyricularia grisea TaxID=148305 RepID=A0A6P8BAD6_PYRGI|nr:uncharacterized protein PgNI_04121 [Pyricularia grisea]TLD12778.1 hypothetical protein PgNI_04121 [Pyricularia grisea]
MASIWGNDKHQHNNNNGKLPAWKRLSSLVRRGSNKRSSNGHAYAPSLQKVPSGHRVLETSVSTPHLLGKHNGDAKNVAGDVGNVGNISSLKAPLLEVNLEPLRSYRLSDGWLDNDDPPPPTPPPKDDLIIGRDSKRNSSTPIADLFSKSTDQLATALQTISRKPVPPKPEPSIPEPAVPEPSIIAEPSIPDTSNETKSISQQPQRQLSTASDTRGRRPLTISVDHDASASVAGQPIRISLRDSSVGFEGETKPTHKRQHSARKPIRASWAGSSGGQTVPTSPLEAAPSDGAGKSSVKQVNLLRSVGNNTSGMRVTGASSGTGSSVDDVIKRHSMPSPTELQFASANLNRTKDTIGTRTSSPVTALRPPLAPADDARRRTWQPPVSPALTNSSTNSRRSVSGSRPPSTALTSSRLAWIRELEGGRKNKSMSGSDSKALRDVGGGVAGKLAMFEQKQQQVKPPSSVLGRSNSNTSRASRMSVSVVGASSNEDDVPTTRRTSVESTRSAVAPVMAYYDQAFREKMEGVTQLASKRLNGEDDKLESQQDGLRKVTARLVDLDTAKKTAKTAGEEKKPAEEQPVVKPAEEQTVEKPVEEQTVAKPVEEQIVEKPVEEQTAAEPTEEEPVSKSAEEPVVEPVEEQSVSKPAEEEVVVKPAEVQPEAVPMAESVATLVEEPLVAEPVESSQEQEKSLEQEAEQAVPKPDEEQIVEEQAEANVEVKSEDKAEEKVVEKTAEKVELPVEPLASSDPLKM